MTNVGRIFFILKSGYLKENVVSPHLLEISLSIIFNSQSVVLVLCGWLLSISVLIYYSLICFQ